MPIARLMPFSRQDVVFLSARQRLCKSLASIPLRSMLAPIEAKQERRRNEGEAKQIRLGNDGNPKF